MDNSLFSSIIKNLHSIEVYSLEVTSSDQASDIILSFCEKYCYHEELQYCYTYSFLNDSIKTIPDNTILRIIDSLGIRILIFKLFNITRIIGPYVTKAFEEKEVHHILINHHLPASYIQSISLYHSAFPLVSEADLVHNINAVIHSFIPDSTEYTFRHMNYDNPSTASNDSTDEYSNRFDYRSIKQRYSLENTFLNMIEEGDTKNVLKAFDNMAISDLNSKRYINAVYYMPEHSQAMIRALSRKAAERGGVPFMEINEITQKAVQKSKNSSNEREYIKNLHEMIYELTAAVRRHRLSESTLSPTILNAVSYIRTNYSQDISLEELAEITDYSTSYLSRQFKKEAGCTITEYIRRLRCTQAAALLKKNNAPIASIGAYVGYADNNYFVKAFKKEYNMTPSEWRRTNQTN